MFLSTLGLKSDGMITEMVRAQRQSYDGAIAPVEDRRGSHPPSNKCDAEVIRLHINSYNPAINHYKRKNAPYKRYLNPEMTIKEMYKNFLENKENNKICYKTCCNVFKSENIGFSRLSLDEWEICLSCKDLIEYSDHDCDQCEECIAYAKHKVRYSQAHIEYQNPSQRKLFVLPLICKELLYSLKSSPKNTYL